MSYGVAAWIGHQQLAATGKAQRIVSRVASNQSGPPYQVMLVQLQLGC
jgi:hypothetical protein